MKVMKFRENLSVEILEGRKNVTWRLLDDKDLTVGDRLDLFVFESGNKFAEAEIANIYEKKLGDIEEKDFDGHERYESKEAMIEAYRGYYGDKVSMDTMVKIIKFEILNSK